jgi:hypothetical protein
MSCGIVGGIMRGIDSFFLALHIATIILVTVLLTGHQFVDLSIYKSASNSLAKGQVVDAVSLAAQLGRLDLVSALLATIGFLVGVAGIVGYTEIRNRAIREARDAAIEYVNANLGPLVRREFDRMASFETSAGQAEASTKEVDAMKDALGKEGER